MRGPILALATCLAAAGPGPAPAHAARPPLQDAPVAWFDDDRADVPEPAERDPNLRRDQLHVTVARPLRRHTSPDDLVKSVRAAFGGARWDEAHDVNSLDEVPNSSWFTNRLGLFALTPEEVARGPGDGNGPDRSGPWTVVRAKTEGVTPGERQWGRCLLVMVTRAPAEP